MLYVEYIYCKVIEGEGVCCFVVVLVLNDLFVIGVFVVLL